MNITIIIGNEYTFTLIKELGYSMNIIIIIAAISLAILEIVA